MYNLVPKLNSKQMLFLYRQLVSVVIFAVLYYVIYYYVETDTFHDPNKKYTFFDFLYFSLGTQCTIGYGDLYPTHFITKLITAVQLLSVVTILIVAIS